MPVYKDKKTGKWYCKFYYTDYTGEKKQKLKRGFKLQREAKEWERNFLEHMQGTPDMTFQTLYNHYMEDITYRLRPGTVSGKKNRLENRILPYFKDKPINQITAADIRKWQNEQISKGYSESYLRVVDATLVAILNFAVDYYNLPANPCNKVKNMGKIVRSMNFWTLDQYKAAVSVADHPTFKIMLQMLFYSGVRIGELLALTIEDCNFDARTINIDKTLYRINGEPIIAPPKTKNSIRIVSMPAAIMDDLRAYIDRIYKPQKDTRIFMTSKSAFRYNMIKYAKNAGVSVIRNHDLRHSHVSLLIELGFSPHLIADRIGDTVQMVNNTYGHLYPNKQYEVAERLEKLMK